MTTLPVIEVFGPTIQGEGPDAGQSCYFVRFGGCDYRCSWCDSLYAVTPAEVKKHAVKMEAGAIVEDVCALSPGPEMVVYSGGNPALLELGDLTREFHDVGMKVSIETQGSVWKRWMRDVDRIVISPKPPSSGMATKTHEQQTALFMGKILNSSLVHRSAVKIVIADREDYEWAINFMQGYMYLPTYFSVLTPQIEKEEGKQQQAHDLKVKDLILEKYAWLCELVARDERAKNVKVLPQMHVLAWGTIRGV